ncbi:MAG TPA: hypothetical protein VN711_02370, partial [Candidatus Saccharimonadales bacterium]|nr:hypothetical protein [Candidatus Saccharimonadales bacterium]
MTHDELLPTGENIPVLAIDGLDLRVRATPKNAPDPPLRLTDIPHTFLAQAPVLNPRQIREIHRSLAENDPSRIRLFQAVHAHNRAMLHQYPRIGVYLDGRSIVGNKKKYTITRDGSWGDAVEASIAIEATLQAGKDVTVLSSQPSVFGRAERHTPDRVSHIQIPDDVFPFQFYPFSLPGNPSLLNFLFQHQGQDMAYIAPLNARLPVIFRVEEGGGVLDERTLRAVNTLKEAVHGTRTDPFSGIHMREWENLCHQSQALQVMIDLLGIDTRRWEKFPRPYLNPPAAARQLAREYAGYFSPDAINTVFHIGVANNMK